MGAKCHKYSSDPHSFSKYQYIEYQDILEYENFREYDNILEDVESWFR